MHGCATPWVRRGQRCPPQRPPAERTIEAWGLACGLNVSRCCSPSAPYCVASSQSQGSGGSGIIDPGNHKQESDVFAGSAAFEGRTRKRGRWNCPYVSCDNETRCRVASFAGPLSDSYWKCLDLKIEWWDADLGSGQVRTPRALPLGRWVFSTLCEPGLSSWAHQLEIPSCRIYRGCVLRSAAFQLGKWNSTSSETVPCVAPLPELRYRVKSMLVS